MQFTSIIVPVLIIGVVAVTAQNLYDNKYDGIDIEMVLSNQRLLENHVKCLINEGPCTADSELLKRVLPEALENKCTKCTEIQLEKAKKVIRYLAKEKPEYWEKLKKVYDPEGKYASKYGDLLKEILA
ncbi:putative odorant-binding protein A10 [Chrysoperla carnea]|uniref:putative odorant-binding protein A10 n=1 Tax=Chrysoperla carnea TaxID=189513 RepID=UPI001D0689C5|nr:putative odorant-binding protein A10 [Chrysoperla carnea]